jgi:hypothetical protein
MILVIYNLTTKFNFNTINKALVKLTNKVALFPNFSAINQS